jgi:hypothetical protein
MTWYELRALLVGARALLREEDERDAAVAPQTERG